MYIRESYKSIASSILQQQQSCEDARYRYQHYHDNRGKVILTGTAGIGKSFFLIYLLWKLITEEEEEEEEARNNKRVVFLYHPFHLYFHGGGGRRRRRRQGGLCYFVRNNLPSAGNISFWNESLWCLFDAKCKREAHLGELPYSFCNFVISTPPRGDLVHEFQKPYPVPRVFYMPVWSRMEMEAIAPLFMFHRHHRHDDYEKEDDDEGGSCFEKEWRKRFDILGGIPRTVLEDMSRDAMSILKVPVRNVPLLIAFDQ
jgi:hypothetical protein